MMTPDDTLRERLIAAGLALAALVAFVAAFGGCVWLAFHVPTRYTVIAGVGLVAGLVFLRVYLIMRDVRRDLRGRR